MTLLHSDCTLETMIALLLFFYLLETSGTAEIEHSVFSIEESQVGQDVSVHFQVIIQLRSLFSQLGDRFQF